MKIYEVYYLNLFHCSENWLGNVKEYPIGYYRSIKKVRRAIKEFNENTFESQLLPSEFIKTECKKLKASGYYQSIANHNTEQLFGCFMVITIKVE